MPIQQFVYLKPKVQIIIDLIAKKEWKKAQLLQLEVSEEVENLIDEVVSDNHLIELSKYQVLLTHLLLKIQNRKSEIINRKSFALAITSPLIYFLLEFSEPCLK